MSLKAVCVKTDPDWESSADCYGVSEAAKLAGLYADHVVKDELVLSPEVLQAPDVVYTMQGQARTTENKCPVKIKEESPEQIEESSKAEKHPETTTLSGHSLKTKAASNEVPSPSQSPVNKSSSTTSSKIHYCSHCDYKTSYKSHLRNHMSVHTGEKPFQCSHCNRKFRLKCSLQRHVWMRHRTTD